MIDNLVMDPKLMSNARKVLSNISTDSYGIWLLVDSNRDNFYDIQCTEYSEKQWPFGTETVHFGINDGCNLKLEKKERSIL